MVVREREGKAGRAALIYAAHDLSRGNVASVSSFARAILPRTYAISRRYPPCFSVIVSCIASVLRR